MVKIRNSQTGQEMEVGANQLGQYGLSVDDVNKFKVQQLGTDQTTPIQPTQSATQPTQTQPLTSMPSLPSTPPASPTDISDPKQKSWQQAFENESDAKKKDSIANAWKTSRGYELYGSPEETRASRAKEVATKKDQSTAAENSISIVNNIMDTWKQMPEFEKRLPGFLADTFGFLAPNRSAIRSSFFTNLEGELRKSAIGGRITQQEIQWIRSAILPNEFDSEESAQANVDAFKEGIQKKLKNPNYNMSQGKISKTPKTEVTISSYDDLYKKYGL